MIVYGDPQFEEDAAVLVARLRAGAAALRGDSVGPSLDELRTLLIQVGQLEQAGCDELPDPAPHRSLPSQLQAATDFAAAAFYARWRETQGAAPAGATDVRTALAGLETALSRVEAPQVGRLTVKVPEGFAFYALYPDQYCLSALRWLADCREERIRRAVVVGIRSIGTTLSAVVAVVLAAGGWQVRRLTVRPAGHPFSRRVEIDLAEEGAPGWGLVVDEGPGLSGSSLSATGEALCRAGIQRSRIRFLPSHDGVPVGAAEATRVWWEIAPVYATPFRDLAWNGLSVPERLAARTSELCGAGEAAARIEDCGGGLWREMVYSAESDWPAAFGPFERTKYRCTAANGGSVLWKFVGQAAVRSGAGSAVAAAEAELERRARDGWTPAPLGAADGFLALPWVEGAPLTRLDGDAATQTEVGRYIAQAAGPALTPTEQEAGLGRMAEILYWNTWEALGEETADRTRRWVQKATEAAGAGPASSYGDGRLAPYEWRRSSTGRLIKLDGVGHDVDHTAVGRQSLLWDVAGAMVEWQLDTMAGQPLLHSVQREVGQPLSPVLLHFYRMAYAAFRLGLSRLCADMLPGWPAEQERLRRAEADYRGELERLLESEG